MVVKCDEHLHPLIEFERSVANHDIFIIIMIAIWISLKRLQIYKRFHPKGVVDFQMIPNGYEKHQMCSSMVGET